MNKFRRFINYFTSVLLVVFVLICLYAGFLREEVVRLEKENIELAEQIINLDLNNGAMEIKQKDYDSNIRAKDKKIESLKEDLAVKELVLIYTKDEIESLVKYLEFMQHLCDANNLNYPYYVTGD